MKIFLCLFTIAFVVACIFNPSAKDAPPKQIDECDSCVLVQKDSCRMEWDRLCKENFMGYREVCHIKGYCDPKPDFPIPGKS